jgi:hypothetical protein
MFKIKNISLLSKVNFENDKILRLSVEAYNSPVLHITDKKAPLSGGGMHDYYSNGDYWWPNPDSTDGLPYVRRDGESNPGNFIDHRNAMNELKFRVAELTAGYMITGDEKYAEKAVKWLDEFFLDENTYMTPHLLYAQAIPGVCSGRGIGIIDTLHLIGIPVAVEKLKKSEFMKPEIYNGIKKWFSDYLDWMLTHEYGIAEMNEKNNHSVCFFVQVALFAKFTGNDDVYNMCKEVFKNRLFPNQLALDGSFPLEIARTKPYGYSLFVLDNFVNLCLVLSDDKSDFFSYELKDGRSIRKALDFMCPFIADKSKWPYNKDIQFFDDWPVSIPFMVFAGLALNERKYIDLWNSLDKFPVVEEVRRTCAIYMPIIWL